LILASRQSVVLFLLARKTLLKAFSIRLVRQSLGFRIAILVATATSSAIAAKNEAHVTRIIRDVKLLPSQAAPKPAVLNDAVNDNTAVRTGDASRSELTFVDLRITRLGANTLFAFNNGGHSVQLNTGSMLLYVPKNTGGAQMATSAVSVAITGTTVGFESRKAGRTILKVFEGGARASLIKYPREAVFVRSGQMVDVPAGATKMPQPTNMNMGNELNSPLFTDFPPLPSRNLIATGPNTPNYPTTVVQPPIPIVPWLPIGVIPGSHPPPTHTGGTNTGTGTVGTGGSVGSGGHGTTTTATNNVPVGVTTRPGSHDGNGTPAPKGGTIHRDVSHQTGHATANQTGTRTSVKSGQPSKTPTPHPPPPRRSKKPGVKVL
jgi:hypothetical protein